MAQPGRVEITAALNSAGGLGGNGGASPDVITLDPTGVPAPGVETVGSAPLWSNSGTRPSDSGTPACGNQTGVPAPGAQQGGAGCVLHLTGVPAPGAQHPTPFRQSRRLSSLLLANFKFPAPILAALAISHGADASSPDPSTEDRSHSGSKLSPDREIDLSLLDPSMPPLLGRRSRGAHSAAAEGKGEGLEGGG